MKSCRGSSELIFVVLNFVTPEARYANDVNNRLKIRGWKNSWVENFVTSGIVTNIFFFFFFFFYNDKGNKELYTQKTNQKNTKTKANKQKKTKNNNKTNMEGKVRGCHPLMELVWGAGESTKWRCPSTEGWRSAERGGELNRQGDYPDVDQ